MLQNPNWDRPHANSVSELLLKGADLIEKHGHTKNNLYDDNGAMCFMGALWKAMDAWDIGLRIQAATSVKRVLGLPNPTRSMGLSPDISAVVDWNNAPERTAQEVIDAMRLAARMNVSENIKETVDAV
jgi:hypothetical protein